MGANGNMSGGQVKIQVVIIYSPVPDKDTSFPNSHVPPSQEMSSDVISKSPPHERFFVETPNSAE